MNDKIAEALKNIEIHADVLMKIPANEQNLGAIQSVVSVALLEIKRCLEAIIATEEESPTPVSHSAEVQCAVEEWRKEISKKQP